MPNSLKKYCTIGLLLALSIGLSGCSRMVKKKAGNMLSGFVDSVMKQDDPDLVREAMPSYLLILDGLIDSNSDNPQLLAAGAQLYSAFGSGFFEDMNTPRAKAMGQKAKKYAFAAMALVNPSFKENGKKSFAGFEPIAATITKEQQSYLGTLIMAWAFYIETHMEDSDNYADLPKLDLLAHRFLELDETYGGGMPHQVMALLYSLVPESLGGQPEKAKMHFEKAIAISKGHDLGVYVSYAKRYARPKFDQEMHDKLLKYVLDTPADIEPSLTLMNTMAKADAKKLLDESAEYFE